MSTVKTLEQWLSWLENTRPETQIEFGLERIEHVARSMGLLKPAPFVITVGGTNGKGSTLAVMESILQASGTSVGLFTSPHFLHFRERIRINGEPVADAALAASFAAIDAARGEVWLSYFEFATLAAMHQFQQAGVAVALMEVGMGGRLDATNVVDSDVAVVTTIALDHQEFLGDTVEAIALEKAGIYRVDKPAIFGADALPQSLMQTCYERGAKLIARGRDFTVQLHGERWQFVGVSAAGEPLVYDDLPVPDVVLDNAATALQALVFCPLPVCAKAVVNGLQRVQVTGRFQRINHVNSRNEPVEIVLDVAHNPQAAQFLSQRWAAHFGEDATTNAVFAVCKDKDYRGVMAAIAPLVNEWFAAEFASPRALPVAQLEAVLLDQQQAVESFDSVIEAFVAAVEATENGGRVLVVGSFMTVAAVLMELQNKD